MKYVDMTAKDCEHIRHFLTDIQIMFSDKDLGMRNNGGFMYEGACLDPTYRKYMEISHALNEANSKLSELEYLIKINDRMEAVS